MLKFGPFSLDPVEKTLRRDNELIAITPKGFDLLIFLAMRPGKLVSREEILAQVWPETTVEEGNLSVHISNLRRLLGENASEPMYIETVARRGYRFIAPVTEVKPEPSPEPEAEAEVVAGPAARSRLGWSIAAVIALAAIAGIAWIVLFRRQDVDWTPVPLTSTPGLEMSPALSPDGSQVLFAVRTPRAQMGIWLQKIGSPPPIRLTNSFDFNPAWSPDGQEFAYAHYLDEAVEIRVRSAFGNTERSVGTVEYLGLLPGPMLNYSPDGKWILTSEGGGPPLGRAPRRLVAFPARGGALQVIQQPPPGIAGDSAPALSPTGDQLAFCRCDSSEACHLYVTAIKDMKPAGSPLRISNMPSAEIRAVFLPDGSLLYPIGPPESRVLWRTRFNLLGRPESAPISSAGEDILQPTAARTSSGRFRIAYVRNTMDFNIWKFDLKTPDGDSSGPGVPLIASTRSEMSPSFSPDGKRVAFASTRSGHWEIWSCTADGRDCRQLSSLGPAYSRNPAWSPDGRWIAFDSRPTSEAQLFLIPAEGGIARQLTSGPHSHLEPSWSGDGKWLYFTSNRSGRYEIYRSPAPSSPGSKLAFEQLTTRGGTSSKVSTNGSTFFFRGPDVAFYRMTAPAKDAQRLPPTLVGSISAGPEGLIYGFVAENRKGYVGRFDWRSERMQMLQPATPLGTARSPDGRRILYVQNDREESDLMYLDLPLWR